MSENNDKKQGEVEEIVYKKAEVVGSGSRFYEQTIIEETIIEEVTVSSPNAKSAASVSGGDNKIESSKTETLNPAGTKTDDAQAVGTTAQASTANTSNTATATANSSIKANTTANTANAKNAGAGANLPQNEESKQADGDKPEKGKKAKKKRSGLNKFLNTLLVFVIVVLACTIVFLNVFVLCPVSQESMTPTILDGQRVLLLRGKGVKRDEIFVFDSGEVNSATGEKINLIKRAVGVGGDRLLYATSSAEPLSDSNIVVLYRDTGAGFVLLEESFINEPMLFGNMPETEFCKVYIMDGDTVDEAAAADYIITVPEGHFYALGDNRNNSNDSREIGFVQKKMVIGRLRAKLKRGSFAEKVLRVLYRDTKSK